MSSITEHTDPVNAQILAVSEDKIQGFVREPFAEIAGPFLRKDVAACLQAAAQAGADLGLLGDVVGTGPLSLKPVASK